jgi:ferric iron reductase protein FhuF
MTDLLFGSLSMPDLARDKTKAPMISCEVAQVVQMYEHLRTVHPNWFVEFGEREGDGWIKGKDFRTPVRGPFMDLLSRIGDRLKTPDHGIVAAAFALGFGRSAAAVVGPFLLHRCVPDLRLENASFRFDQRTLFERVSLHRVSGVTTGEGELAELLAVLRDTLVDETEPVVDALHRWSGLTHKAIWGQMAASWGAQFVNVFTHLGEPLRALDSLASFFDDPRLPFKMQPEFYSMTRGEVTRIFQRRAACCFYHKIPDGRNCMSCPLISRDERLRRNAESFDA